LTGDEAQPASAFDGSGRIAVSFITAGADDGRTGRTGGGDGGDPLAYGLNKDCVGGFGALLADLDSSHGAIVASALLGTAFEKVRARVRLQTSTGFTVSDEVETTKLPC